MHACAFLITTATILVVAMLSDHSTNAGSIIRDQPIGTLLAIVVLVHICVGQLAKFSDPFGTFIVRPGRPMKLRVAAHSAGPRRFRDHDFYKEMAEAFHMLRNPIQLFTRSSKQNFVALPDIRNNPFSAFASQSP